MAEFNEAPISISAAVPHYTGHRERLRERFRQGGAEAMPDYELLELVLFRAIPRRDTKPLAKAILAKFGSFTEAINASEERLAEVPGLGAAAITELKVIRAAALRMMQKDVMQKPVIDSWSKLVNYCRAAMGFEKREQFRILFLDKRNHIIADEVQGKGTVDHTPVYVREVLRRALELAASAIILVHDHPSGNATPSQADVAITKEIIEGAKPLGILVHDHLIITRREEASLRGLGLI